MKERFSSRVRELCIKRDWFTGGDIVAYEKMLAACNDPSFSTRDIALMIYLASDADFNEVLQAIDEERSAHTGNNILLSSKDYAAYLDIFSGEIIHGCRDIVRAMVGKPCGEDAIDDVYYNCEYHQQFEMLASDLIRQATGLTYSSDGTDF